MTVNPRFSAFLDQLRERITLSDVIQSHTRLVRRGRLWEGLCPFHQEKTPSFKVNDDEGFYYCFGCKARGDSIHFVMETQRLPFIEAVQLLADRVGLTVPERTGLREKSPTPPQNHRRLYELLNNAHIFFQHHLTTPGAQGAQTYLKDRHVTPESQKIFELGWAPPLSRGLPHWKKEGFSSEELTEAGLIITPEDQQRKPYDRFRERLMFPIHNDRGRVVAFGGRLLDQIHHPKYLNSPETPIFHKGNELYGWFQLLHNSKLSEKPVFIVEGYFDVITLQGMELGRALAPLGTALTDLQIAKAWRLSPMPYLCFDGDEAGRSATLKACERFLPLIKPGYSVQIVQLPFGDDPHSLLTTGRQHLFENAVKAAQPLDQFLWEENLRGRSLRSPEQKAWFREHMKKYVAMIKDSAVRSLYSDAFQKRWRELLAGTSHESASPPKKTHPSQARWTKAHSTQRITQDSSPRPQFDSLFVQQALLLLVPINYPHFLNEFHEQLTMCPFLSEDLESLRGVLLEWLPPEDLSSEQMHRSLMEHLNNHSCHTLLKRIDSEKIYLHGTFARQGGDPEKARQGWVELFKRYEKNSILRHELDAKQKEFSHSATASNWNRLKQLKDFYCETES